MIKFFRQMLIPLFVLCMIALHTATGYAQMPAPADNSSNVFLPFVAGGSVQADQLIPNQYIVVFKEDLVTSASVSAVAADMVAQYNGSLLQTYDAALNGFAVSLPTAVITDALTAYQQDSRVAFVEQDQVVTLDPNEAAESVISETIPTEASSSATDATQVNPPWGLDRLDQRSLPLNARYNYGNTGAGVRVYIIDTGIRITHSEFQGRAIYGADFVDNSLPANDCDGHGTHVASTVGGRTYGVAKGVQLIAVRVLGCTGSGSYSQIIAGVNWVTNQRRANLTIPTVANMSLGGAASPALDTAINNSIGVGVTYAIAAGNDSGSNACNISPARVPQAITVGATTSTDARASYSNIGNCLDIFAPGTGITSAWASSDTAINTISGTSMATPHVAGMAALYLQSHPRALPAEVANALNNNATANIVGNPGANSPNRLLYSGLIPFNKVTPANGATQQPTTLTLTWEPSAGAVQYGYCFDAVVDNICGQGVDNFTRINSTSVTVSLQPNTTYEWQVRAYTANGEWSAGNGYGQWWKFTTNPSTPGPFNKINPGNNATNVPVSLDLTWQPSANAVYYLICVTTETNKLCHGTGDNTYFTRVNGTSYHANLATNTVYSWQVRAVGANGSWTPGNGDGQWWGFRTR